uniref:Uncharacterized protein n=1 Tax=Anguilla anguilla TaxID=7936 RepID=A0A0E9SCX2_ANGAN
MWMCGASWDSNCTGVPPWECVCVRIHPAEFPIPPEFLGPL